MSDTKDTILFQSHALPAVLQVLAFQRQNFLEIYPGFTSSDVQEFYFHVKQLMKRVIKCWGLTKMNTNLYVLDLSNVCWNII